MIDTTDQAGNICNIFGVRHDTKSESFNALAGVASVAGAVWVIASAFGPAEKIGITEETFKIVLDPIGTIMSGFGIVNNPTDKDNI